MVYLVKIFITAIIIVGFTELSKKSNFLAAILISLPITSILALSWTYYENRNTQQIAQLSWDIFYLVIASLLFFVILPLMLKYGFSFISSISASIATTLIAYYLVSIIKTKFG